MQTKIPALILYMAKYPNKQQSLYMRCYKKNCPYPLQACNNSIAQISKTEANGHSIKDNKKKVIDTKPQQTSENIHNYN